MNKVIEKKIREMLNLDLQLKGNPEDWKNWYSRQSNYQRESLNKKERAIDNVVATEKVVLVFDWFRWEPVWEIILMPGVEFPESRQIPLLDQHSRFAIHNLKGSTRELELVENFENLGNVILGRTVISITAKDTPPDPWTLIEEGHLTDTSIGYRTFDDATVFLKRNDQSNVRTFQPL